MAALIAFGGGLLSFFSPCVLPLIPSYLSYLTGLSVKQLADRHEARRRTLTNALIFILGFSLVFIIFGAAAGLAGRWLLQYRVFVRVGGGVLLILLGAYFLSGIKLGFLEIEKRLNFKITSKGYRRSFLVGMIFAAAWTPCVGPILGSILTLAASSASVLPAVLLLVFYSLGFGLPFLLAALAVDFFLAQFKRFGRWLWLASLISGLFLIFVGILLLTDNFHFLGV